MNYTIRPIDFKYFFIWLSYSILMLISCHSTTINFLVYAFLMSDQMYLTCLYKWTFFVVNKIDCLFDIGNTSSEIVLNLVMQISKLTSPKIDLFVCLSNVKFDHVKHNLGTIYNLIFPTLRGIKKINHFQCAHTKIYNPISHLLVTI